MVDTQLDAVCRRVGGIGSGTPGSTASHRVLSALARPGRQAALQPGPNGRHANAGEEIPVYIPGVEWEVIAIILGSGLFIDVVSRSGIFSWTAILLTKRSLGDPLKLLIYYSGITVLFSAVLNNVAAMMIVGSLTMVSLEKLRRKDLLRPCSASSFWS